MAQAAAIQTPTHEVPTDHRAEAVEVLLSMLVKSMAAKDPEAIRRFAGGMKRASTMRKQVLFHGAALDDQTWVHLDAFVADLDDYLEQHAK